MNKHTLCRLQLGIYFNFKTTLKCICNKKKWNDAQIAKFSAEQFKNFR